MVDVRKSICGCVMVEGVQQIDKVWESLTVTGLHEECEDLEYIRTSGTMDNRSERGAVAVVDVIDRN